jgi:ATP-binding cassette, subfamily C (CFTR/MRP), member 1
MSLGATKARMRESCKNCVHEQRDETSSPSPRCYSFFWGEYWLAGFSQLLTTSIQVLLPLLLRVNLQYASDAYYGESAPIGRGVGLILGMTAMLTISAFSVNQWVFRGLATGGITRASIISIIFAKTMAISNRAKAGGALPKTGESRLRDEKGTPTAPVGGHKKRALANTIL